MSFKKINWNFYLDFGALRSSRVNGGQVESIAQGLAALFATNEQAIDLGNGHGDYII